MEVAACPPHEFNKSVNKYAIIMYIVSYSFVSVVVFYLSNVRKVYDSLHIRCLSIYLSLSLSHSSSMYRWRVYRLWKIIYRLISVCSHAEHFYTFINLNIEYQIFTHARAVLVRPCAPARSLAYARKTLFKHTVSIDVMEKHEIVGIKRKQYANHFHV